MGRKATKEEMPEIMSIVNSAYSVEEGNTGISFKNTTRFKNLQEVEDCLKNLYVLEGKLVGQIVGVVCVKMLYENSIASIGPVAVHPDHQGKGYGGKIFDFAESLAKITQIDCVSCRTDLFPFYEKRGYIEIERVPAEEYDEMKGTIMISELK